MARSDASLGGEIGKERRGVMPGWAGRLVRGWRGVMPAWAGEIGKERRGVLPGWAGEIGKGPGSWWIVQAGQGDFVMKVQHIFMALYLNRVGIGLRRTWRCFHQCVSRDS